MNRRQELADVIHNAIPWHYDGSDGDTLPVVDAVLEHLAAPVELKPADLEAMGDRAAVEDHEGDVWQKRGGVWCGYEVSDHTSTRLARFGPFRILSTGKA